MQCSIVVDPSITCISKTMHIYCDFKVFIDPCYSSDIVDAHGM